MATFGRLITAMITPFSANGEVDYAQAKRLAKGLIDSGSDSLVVSGTTGESPTLTTKEKLTLFSEIKAAIGNRGQVIAGTGNYNTAESIELSREAEQAGVDGLLLVVPYYNKPPQEGMYQHFRAIAGSTRLPVILYNVPSRTVTNLMAETVIRLSAIDNVVGVKEASGNYAQIGEIVAKAPRGFVVYSGNDDDTLALLALGGYGVISVASHLVGSRIREMINKFTSGDSAGAAAIHHELTPLVKAIFLTANPIPLKAAMNLCGFQVGRPRLPLVELDEKQSLAMAQLLTRYALDAYLQRQPAAVS